MVPSPLWRSSDVVTPKDPKQGWYSWADTASTDLNTPDFCLYSWPGKEGGSDFRCWIVSMPCGQSCKQFPQTQQETFPLVMWPSLKIIKCSCASYPKRWCGCRETSGHSPHYLPVFKDLHSKLSVQRIPVYYAKATRLEDEDHTYTKTVTEVLTKKFTPQFRKGYSNR